MGQRALAAGEALGGVGLGVQRELDVIGVLGAEFGYGPSRVGWHVRNQLDQGEIGLGRQQNLRLEPVAGVIGSTKAFGYSGAGG
jgi:methylaspartate ammonia-lyase